MTQSTDPVSNFVAGGVGGLCCVLVGHPFDTIKVQQQTGMHSSPSAGLRHLVGTEGARGLYRGVASPLLIMAPISCTMFASYAVGKRLLLGADTGQAQAKLPPSSLVAAGAFSGIFTGLINGPAERVKVALQVQTTNTRPTVLKGTIDCISGMYREGGLRTMFKGTPITMVRDVPALAVFFATYDITLRKLNKMRNQQDSNKVQPLATIIAGGIAGLIQWICILPIDTVKSRYQSQVITSSPAKLCGQMWRSEGIKSFYRGLTPVLMRAFPANAVTFLGYELTMHALRRGPSKETTLT